MVSMYIPPKKDAINKANKKLSEEASSASNIKSQSNKNQVLNAITSISEKIKLYKEVPKNGLVIFCGTADQEGKDSGKKFTMDFQPFKPINYQIYHCGPKFVLEPLEAMLVTDKKFGFVIIDGSGTLWATLQGNNKEIVQDMSVMLPKKTGKGSTSAAKFGKIRQEKRQTYLKKVAEMTLKNFLDSNNKLTVEGIILAGSSNFKSDLEKGEYLDQRIQKAVVSIVDVSYGGENGLNEAIWLSSGVLTNVKFLSEKKLLADFYAEIAQGTDMVVFGP